MALSQPRMIDEPRVGSRRPRSMRMVVVLPAPLRPMNAKTLPRGTLKETLSTAHLPPEVARQPARLDHRVTRVGWVGVIKKICCDHVFLQWVWFPNPAQSISRPRPCGFPRAEVEENRLMDEVVDGEP